MTTSLFETNGAIDGKANQVLTGEHNLILHDGRAYACALQHSVHEFLLLSRQRDGVSIKPLRFNSLVETDHKHDGIALRRQFFRRSNSRRIARVHVAALSIRNFRERVRRAQAVERRNEERSYALVVSLREMRKDERETYP